MFSEKGFYTDKISGIIETDYTVDDIQKKMFAYNKSRDLVRKEAKECWKVQNKIAMSFIKTTLKLLGNSKFDFKDYKIKNQKQLEIISPIHKIKVDFQLLIVHILLLFTTFVCLLQSQLLT